MILLIVVRSWPPCQLFNTCSESRCIHFYESKHAWLIMPRVATVHYYLSYKYLRKPKTKRIRNWIPLLNALMASTDILKRAFDVKIFDALCYPIIPFTLPSSSHRNSIWEMHRPVRLFQFNSGKDVVFGDFRIWKPISAPIGGSSIYLRVSNEMRVFHQLS